MIAREPVDKLVVGCRENFFGGTENITPLEPSSCAAEFLRSVPWIWGSVGGRILIGVPDVGSPDFPSFEPRELFPLDVAGRESPITCVSVRNAHAVAVLSELIDDFPLYDIGPLVQNHPLFPPSGFAAAQPLLHSPFTASP